MASLQAFHSDTPSMFQTPLSNSTNRNAQRTPQSASPTQIRENAMHRMYSTPMGHEHETLQTELAIARAKTNMHDIETQRTLERAQQHAALNRQAKQFERIVAQKHMENTEQAFNTIAQLTTQNRLLEKEKNQYQQQVQKLEKHLHDAQTARQEAIEETHNGRKNTIEQATMPWRRQNEALMASLRKQHANAAELEQLKSRHALDTALIEELRRKEQETRTLIASMQKRYMQEKKQLLITHAKDKEKTREQMRGVFEQQAKFQKQAVEKQIEELKEKHAQVIEQANVEAREIKLNEQTQRLTEMSAQVAQRCAENEELHMQSQKAYNDFIHMENRVSLLESQISDLNELIQQKDELVVQLRNDNNEKQKRIDELTRTTVDARLFDQLKSLINKELAAYQTPVAAGAISIATTEDGASSSSNSLHSTLQTKGSTASTKSSSLRASVTQSSANALSKVHELELERLKGVVGNYERSLNDLHSQTQILTENLNARDRELLNAKREVSILRSEKNATTAHLSASFLQQNSNSTDEQSRRNSMASANASYLMTPINEENNVSISPSRARSSHAGGAQIELNDLRVAFMKSDVLCQQLQSKLDASQNELAVMRKESQRSIEALQKQLNDANASLNSKDTDIQIQFSSSESAQRMYEREIEVLADSNRRYQDEIAANQGTIQSFNAACVNAINKLRSIVVKGQLHSNVEISISSHDIKDPTSLLGDLINQCEEQYSDLISTISNLKAVESELQGKVAELQTRNDALSDELALARSDCSDHKQKLEASLESFEEQKKHHFALAQQLQKVTTELNSAERAHAASLAAVRTEAEQNAMRRIDQHETQLRNICSQLCYFLDGNDSNGELSIALSVSDQVLRNDRLVSWIKHRLTSANNLRLAFNTTVESLESSYNQRLEKLSLDMSINEQRLASSQRQLESIQSMNLKC